MNNLYLDNREVDVTTVAYQQSVTTLFAEINASSWTKGDVNSWLSYLIYAASLNTNTNGHACYQSYDSVNKVVVQDKFYPCLNFLLTN